MRPRHLLGRSGIALLSTLLAVAVLLPTAAPVASASAVPAGVPAALGPLPAQVPPPAAALYDETVLDDDPLVYYRFDELTGPAADSSGNGIDGTYGGGAVRGEPGALLDDPSTAVSSPTNNPVAVARDLTLPDDDQARTVELWARAVPSGYSLWSYGDLALRMVGSGGVRLLHNGGSTDVPSLTAPTSTAWHHYVVTITADGLVTFYIDGQVVGSRADVPIWTDRDGYFEIGTTIGAYDEAAVYGTSLSAERVAEHWFRGQTRDATDRCPTTGELDVEDAYGLSVMADEPTTYHRLGDAPQDADERVAYDVAGDCRHGAIGAGMSVADAAVLGTSGSTTHPVTPVEQWALAASPASPPGAGPATAETWFRRTGDALYSSVLRYGSLVQVISQGNSVLRVSGDGGPTVDLGLPYGHMDGTWHHLAVTYDGTIVRVYFDGLEVGSRAVTPTSPGGLIGVGGEGAVDEVAIYPTGLTAARIRAHWAAGRAVLGPGCPVASGGYGGTVVADGPAVYLRAGERSADAGARVAVDSSGACRHGAIDPGATGTTGALVGTSDGATVTGGATGVVGPTGWRTDASSPLTVETWARRGSGSLYDFIVHHGTTAGLSLATQGTSAIRFRYNGLSVDLATPFPLLDDQWHHYVVAFDGASVTLYVDGVAIGSRAVTSIPVGGHVVAAGSEATDELATYPTALSAVTVAQHWGAGRAGLTGACPVATGAYASAVLDDEPVAFYRLGERSTAPAARVAVDGSGGCRHGAIPIDPTATTGAVLTSPDGALARSSDGPGVLGTASATGTGPAPATVEGWVRRTWTTNQWLLRNGDRFGVQALSASALRLRWNGTSGSADVPLPMTAHDDEWHHLALSYDGTNLHLFFDGIRVATRAAAVTAGLTGPLHAGGNGAVDEVALYPTALPAASIVAHWSVGRSSDGSRCRSGSSSGHAQAVLDDDPVQYWRVGDVDQGGTGQVAFDASGACANGAFARSATATTGALAGSADGAVAFSDPTGCVTATCAAAVSGTGDHLPGGTSPFSVEMWSTATQTGRFLWEHGERNGLWIQSSTLIRLYRTATVYQQFTLPSALASGWHHWAVTYDGSVARIYLDGAVVGTTAAGWVPGPGTLGAELRVGGANGAYDEIAVFDRALTGSEIAGRRADATLLDTSTTLTGPEGLWLSDRPLDFTATVASPSGVPGGTVELWDDGVLLATDTLDGAGEADLTVSLDEGPHVLTAVYTGSSSHITSRSAPQERPVLLGYDTATDVVVEPSPAVVGRPATAVVTVSEVEPVPGDPTGTVEVLVDDEVVGTGVLDAAGGAEVALPALAVGEHDVTARYVGGGDHLESTSPVVGHEVVQAEAAITVEGLPATLPWSAPVELDVTVDPVAPATVVPTGTVTVEVDDEPVDTATLIDGAATLEVTGLAIGEHEVVVTYGGSTVFASAVAPAGVVEVVEAGVALTVATDPTSSAEGDEVEIGVTLAPVAPATAVPDGSVELFDGSRPLGSVETVDGEATLVVDDLTYGPHTIRAVFGGSEEWLGATDEVGHDVLTGATVTLGPIAATVWGQAATASVRVRSDDPDEPLPTGTVVLLDEGDDEVGSGTIDSTGRAEIAVEGLPVGSEDLVAVYQGDDDHAVATSDPVTAVVTPASAHVTLTAAPNPVAVDGDVTLVARVVAVAPGAGTPTGFVTFTAEGDPTPLAIVALGPTGAATATVSFDTEGTVRLRAAYGGDTSFLPRTSAAVVQRVEPGTDLALSADPPTASHGEDVELTAVVTSTATTPVGSVTFLLDDEELGTEELDGAGEAVLVVDDLPVGEHDIVAEYAGEAFGPSSDTVTVEIDAAATTVEVEIEEGTTSTYGTDVTAVATITATGLAPEAITGFVAISVDGDPVATVAAVDGEAQVALEDLDVGEHEVTAAYGGRADGALGASSGDVDHEVTEAPTAIVLAEPGDPIAPGAEVELEATVTRTTEGGIEDPTGTVTFSATGVGPLGSAPLVDGVAVLVTDDLATVGPWEITAAYAGDSRHLPATSDPEVWTVRAAVTVAVTPPVGATDLGDPAAFAVSVTPALPGAVPTGSVELREQSGRLLATATLDGSGAATLVTTGILGGATTLVVRYAGDATYAPAGSDPFVHVVAEGSATLALDAVPDPVAAGHPVAFVATVTGPVPGIRPTGEVRFELPSGALHEVVLDGDGRAVLRRDDLAVGTHEVEAVYLGDRSHDPSAPEVVEVAVVAVPELGVTVTPDEGTVGLEVTAEATGSPGAATLAWDFGDGGSGSGATATHTYDEAGLYTVTLAVGLGGATSYATARVEVGEDGSLAAAAGPDQTVADGEDALFDGRSSTPVPGIETWLWELGDGTTSDEPTLTHAYAEPGTYGVRLTVTRDGVTATDESTVTVEEVDPDQGLHVTVLGTDGPLAGADVLVIDSGAGEFRGSTDEDGTTVLAGLADNRYSVYAIARGYRPKMVKATVVDGYATAELTLEEGERAITDTSSKQLTTEEIIAAGLDPDDPDNSRVWEFRIWLNFGLDPEWPIGEPVPPLIIMANNKGAIADLTCTPTVCRHRSVNWDITGHVRVDEDQRPTITWIVMPGRAQWLKEVFEVQMVVQNLADPDFAFEDGAMSLDLPAGLSLAGLVEPQSTVVEVPDILGGTSASARWILRGDASGEYTVRTDYTASLYPLGVGVHLEGETAEPLKVYGADALELEVVADEEAFQYSPYLVDVNITNVADIPVHNLGIELFEDGIKGFIYQPEHPRRFHDDELAPGETLVGHGVLVPNAFSDDEDDGGEDDLDLEESFIESLGGTDTLPATLSSRPAIPRSERPVLCVAGSRLDENGVCGEGQLALGQVTLTWTPTTGLYRVYRTTDPHTPFPDEPLAEVTGTTYTYTAPAGEVGFFAVSSVGPDGSEMFHNAITAGTGVDTSARLDLFVECFEGDMALRIDYHDEWHPLERFQIGTVVLDDAGDAVPGQFVGGDELNGYEGSTSWPLPPSVFEGDHVIELPSESGGPKIKVASLFVQAKNVADDMWGPAVPVMVYEDCTAPFDGIPAEQTFGTGCETNQYYGRGDVKGMNPTKCEADPVNTATGSLVVSAGDVAMVAPGVSFDMARTYNSADETTGPLGRGWTHPYDESLSFPEDGVITYRAHDGQQVVFYEDTETTLPGDWFYAASSPITIKKTPVPSECGGCTYVVEQPGKLFSHFDAEGNLLRVQDRNGVGLSFDNDPAGNPLTATDGAGRQISFDYTDGLLTAVTLPDERHVTYGYTGGLLTSVVDLRGGTTTYRYEDGLLVEETNARGKRVHLTAYDPVTGRVVSQEDGVGNTATWAWDAGTGTSTMTDSTGATWTSRYEDNVLMSETDPLGRTTTYAYDAHHNLVQTVRPDGTRLTETWDDRGNRTRTSGPLGITHEYDHDADGNLVGWSRPDGTSIAYGYDSAGRLDEIEGPETSATAHHDPDGLVEWTEDALGRRTEMGYDADGNLISECTPLEHCTTRTYDATGRLLTVVGPNGNAPDGEPEDHDVSFTYDAADNRATETDPLGGTTTYTHDAAGNVVTIEEPGGRTIVRTYDDADRMVTESIEGGPPTVLTYDGRDNLTRRTTPEGRVTTWTYDAADRISSVTDGEGGTTAFGYDLLDRRIWVRDPAGGVTRTAYDAAGRAVRVVDPLGGVTTTAYDVMGRPVRVTDPTGATTRTTYDDAGRVATVEDPAGRVTTHRYDAVGKPVRTTGPDGAATRTDYDIDGRVTAIVGPEGLTPDGDAEAHTTHFVLDAAGNVETTIDPLDRVTTTTYDALGRVLTQTEPGGRLTERDYDAAGRLTEIRTPDGEPTEWVYDAAGDLVLRRQPDGGETTYTYDDDHLQLTETDPLDRTWRIAYDGAGRLERTWDAIATAAGPEAPATSTTSYDAAGRPVRLDFTDPATADVTTTYDAAGRPTSVRDGAGLETYRYDAAGRLLERDRGTDVFTHGYDVAGQPTTTTYPDGTAVETTFDPAGRTRSVSAFGERATYDWDVAGRLEETRFPNGVVEKLDYDLLGRMTVSAVTRGLDIVTYQVRSYEDDGDVATDSTPAGTLTYAHDDRERLTDVCVDTCPTVPTTTYRYDEAGNRIEEEADGLTAVEATYDAADQTEAHLPAAGEARPLVHDGNGNVVDDGVRSYRYDAAGRLVEVRVSDPGIPMGSIAGTVTDPSDQPVEGVVVRAYADDREVGTATTSAAGGYTLADLPEGEYDVLFDTVDQGGHVLRWHGGTSDPASSAPVAVTAGATSDADAELRAQPAEAVLSGVVVDEVGNPIEGARTTVSSITPAGRAGVAEPSGLPLPGEPAMKGLSVRGGIDGEWVRGGWVPVRAGTPTSVSIEVVNTGLVDLEGVVVGDTSGTPACPVDDGDRVIDHLAVGQKVTCTVAVTPALGFAYRTVDAWADGETVEDIVGSYGYGACTITGTSGPDHLVGTTGADVICGLGSHDEIEGGGGDDVLLGGPGPDIYRGGPGDDVIHDMGLEGSDVDAGSGADLVRFGASYDFVFAGSGYDTVYGGPGDDQLYAGADGARLFGGEGTDRLFGGVDEDLLWDEGLGDRLSGSAGDDVIRSGGDATITGGGGNDTVTVTAGSASTISTGAGEDVILSGPGADTITGGGDADVMLGSAGADTFPSATAADSIVHDDYVATTTTDAEGRWTMRVPAGIYSATTSAPGFLAQSYDGTTWQPAAEDLVVWKVREAELAVDLATDPSWVATPEHPVPDLGEPGEVLARYTYDAVGNRMSATTAEGTTRYTWDTSSGLARLATTSGAQGDRTVVWGVSGPLSVREPGEDPVFLHTDAIGSVTAVTDVEGEVVGQGAYDPFGALRWTDGGDGPLVEGSDLFGFAGEQYDAETALYHLRARYYDPAWGRFTQPDPLGPAPGAGHESTYLYAGGSPLSHVDPTGLFKEHLAREQAELEALEVDEDAEEPIKAPGWVHPVLAGFGLVPGYGEPVDVLDGAIYWLEGERAEAFLSWGAAVPWFGTVATGRRLLRNADEVFSALRGTKKGFDAIEVGMDLRRSLDTFVHPNLRQAFDKVAGGIRTHIDEVITAHRANPELGAARLPIGRRLEGMRDRVRRAADASPRPPRKGQSKTVAVMHTRSGGMYTGRSGWSGDIHPQAQTWLGQVQGEASLLAHGRCAEIHCITQALNAGEDVTGAWMVTARVRGFNTTAHGTPREPCASCESVLDDAGITYFP